jgi:hypothetical protein
MIPKIALTILFLFFSSIQAFNQQPCQDQLRNQTCQICTEKFNKEYCQDCRNNTWTNINSECVDCKLFVLKYDEFCLECNPKGCKRCVANYQPKEFEAPEESDYLNGVNICARYVEPSRDNKVVWISLGVIGFFVLIIWLSRKQSDQEQRVITKEDDPYYNSMDIQEKQN